jgi:N-acetylglucosamine transport system substrate-binding protein
VVSGAADGITLPFGLTTAVKALADSGSNGFNWVYNVYYRKLERELVDAACGEFFSGRTTPAEFLAACQKGADLIAADTTFKKYKRSA